MSFHPQLVFIRLTCRLAAMHRVITHGIAVMALVASAPALAETTVLDAVGAGFHSSQGSFSTMSYVTGISYANGNETRGFLAFDLSRLPVNVEVTSALLRVQNIASANESVERVAPLLNVYHLPFTSADNFGRSLAPERNEGNFQYVGSDNRWLVAQIAIPAPPSDTASSSFLELTINATGIADLNANLKVEAIDTYYAYGMRVTLADAQEPKPLQFAFGGVSSLQIGERAQLVIRHSRGSGTAGNPPDNASPIPEPASAWLTLSGLLMLAGARMHRARVGAALQTTQEIPWPSAAAAPR